MPLLTIAAACFGLAVAWWLAPASIEIVTWSKSGLGRIALFAPLYTLWIALAAAAIIALAIWLTGRPASQARARRANIIEPFVALWLWVIPFLPGVAERLPLTLLLAGPIRWCLAAAAMLTALYRWTEPYGPVRLPRQLPGRRAVFWISLAIYLLFGLRSLSIVGLGGDEPHYLVITQSLLADHDLKIENQHAAEQYRAFYPGPLKPDYMQRGKNGEIYSIHAPGLPALLLPGFAIAGSRGAVATICLFAALTALAVFDLAFRIGGAGVAWLTWLSLCLTVPFIPHAWAIYPEMPAAAIVAWAVVWATAEEVSSGTVWLWRGACIAVLPWLHTKFIVFSAALVLWLMVRLRSRLKDAALLVAPVAISGVLWLAFFYVIYGTLDPQAPYGNYTAQFVRFENVPRSLLGILFDQKFGLFVYAPVYLLAALGAWLLVRERRWRELAYGAIVISAAYAVLSARLYMWWGGSSAPARFLVPLVPLAAPMMAIVLTRVQRITAVLVVLIFVGMSVLVAATDVIALDRFWLFSDPHGTARIMQALQGSGALTGVFPTFTDENWIMPLLRLGPWILGGVAAIAVGRSVSGHRVRGSLFWLGIVEGMTFLVVVAVFSNSVPLDARAESVRRGRLDLLDRFNPDGLRAFDYESRTKMSATAWVATGAMVFDLNPAEPADPQGRLTDALTLPAGRYEVKVWFEGERPREGDLLLAAGRGQYLGRVLGPLTNPAVAMLDMPIRVPQLWIQLSEVSSAQHVVRVEVAPVSILKVSERPDVDVRRIESIPEAPKAYMAYVDDFTFPEGGVFWTRGTGAGEVLIAPMGAGAAEVTLHVGPGGGPVHVTAAGREQDVAMQPNETRMLTLPVPAGAAYVPLTIQSSTAFEPAAVDPQSTDTRSLGCQVRVIVH